MKKLISTRQLIFILIISMLTLKVLFLPSLLVKDIGRDSYLFFFFMLILDFLVLLILLFLMHKFQDLSFYEILQKLFGTFFAKVILFLFFSFFVLKCWAIFQSNFVYLNENLHTSIKWFTFSLPLLVVVFYMSTFGVNAFARLIELMFPIIGMGFLLSLATGLTRADFSNLLPFLENGFVSHLPKIFHFSFWFGDYLILIVFFGNVKLDKKFNMKVTLSVLSAILFITFFIAVVYSVFSYNTLSHTNSISDILQVLPSISDLGGFDWVLILIWDVALFLYFTLNVLSAFYCFRQIFHNINQQVVAVGILAIILGSNLLTHFDIIHNIEIGQKYLLYFCMPVQYGLPLLFLIISLFIKNTKKIESVTTSSKASNIDNNENFKSSPINYKDIAKNKGEENLNNNKNLENTQKKEQKC